MVGSGSSLPKGALKLSSLIDALANVCTEACINACEIVFAKWTISHRNLCILTRWSLRAYDEEPKSSGS